MNKILLGSIGLVVTLVLASLLVPYASGPIIDNKNSIASGSLVTEKEGIIQQSNDVPILIPKDIINSIKTKIELDLFGPPISIEAVITYLHTINNLTNLLMIASLPLSFIPISGNIITGVMGGWLGSWSLINVLGNLWLYNQTNNLTNLLISVYFSLFFFVQYC